MRERVSNEVSDQLHDGEMVSGGDRGGKRVKLTKRGEIVLWLGLLTLVAGLIFGIFKVSTSLWWTGGGYCVGSVEECYQEEGKG